MHEAKRTVRDNPNRIAKNVQKKYKAAGNTNNTFLMIDNQQREFAKAMEAEAGQRKYRKQKMKEKRKNDQYL